jgi:hypothetical protein
MQTLVISGSRSWPAKKKDVIRVCLQRLRNRGENPLVVTGGARGVDTWADEIAREMGFTTIVVPARWDEIGRRAGLLRNEEMLSALEDGDEVWAFRAPGESRGTDHMIRIAREAGYDVFVYDPSYFVGVIAPTGPVVPDLVVEEVKQSPWLYLLAPAERGDRIEDQDGVVVDDEGSHVVRRAAMNSKLKRECRVKYTSRAHLALIMEES